MAIVINGNGIDMGGNPVSNASQIDGTVINENGSNVRTENDSYSKMEVDGKIVGFKNLIINGDFSIDQYQRGAQSNWNSANCYIDRFLVANSSSVVRNGAGANNPIGTGLHNHLSITKTAGADTQIMQRWEIPKDKAKQFLNGRTLTFSCFVLAETANFVEHLFFIKNGTSVNSYEVTTFNITKNNKAGIWTRVTGTITNIQWTYEAGEYIEIRLDPVNGLAGNLHTTGWQLEEGSIATPFENRPYGLELGLCQRYYEVGRCIQQLGIGTTIGVVLTGQVFFKTSKRIFPTITYLDFSGAQNKVSLLNNSGTETNGVSVIAGNQTNNDMRLTASTTNTTQNGISFTYTASAEL